MCGQVVEANKDARLRAAEEADALLTQEQLAFEAWRDSLETVPTIKVSTIWPLLSQCLKSSATLVLSYQHPLESYCCCKRRA